MTTPAPSMAGRPPEAILAEQAAAQAEVRDLERRARALDTQAAERATQIRRRLRALYKLSSGGALRLLSRADNPTELAARHDAVRRIVGRDLDELGAVHEEAAEVDAESARRQESLARALALGQALATHEAPTGMAANAGQLVRPVSGPVVAGFGPFKDRGIEVSRRGIELRSEPGQTVRAIAAGRVAWVGDAPGLGRAVAVEHGDGYLTLTGRLRTTLTVGELVVEGGAIGRAASSTLYLELAHEGTPFDPAPWLAR